MEPEIIGWRLARARRRVGLSQKQVAERMGTTQSAVSRLEAGRQVPSIEMLDRFAVAIGTPITLTFGEALQPSDRQARTRRVREALREFRFDPWDRDPTAAEARTLVADGLGNERE